MKKAIRLVVFFLGLAILVAGFLGYCTPDASMDWLSADRSTWNLWQSFVTFIAHNGGTLMLVGIGVILFRILVLPFLLDRTGTNKKWRIFGKNIPLTLFMIPGSL